MNKIRPQTAVSSPPLENIGLWQGETDKMNMIRPNKQILIFCFFLFLFLHQISHAGSQSEKSDTLKICDRWLAWDKVEHLGISAYLSFVSYKIYHDFYRNRKKSSLYFSSGLTIGLGLGKEIYDKKRPNGKFSYKDLVADILGIGVGLWIATR
jgi:uncharacterized protein YfiM (DUF2279 family)